MLIARIGREIALVDSLTLKPVGDAYTLPPLPDDDDRYQLDWSPDGRWLLAGVFRRPATLLRRDAAGLVSHDPKTGHMLARFSPDSRWLLSQSSGDAAWQVIDLRSAKPVYVQGAEKLAAVHMVPRASAVVLLRESGRLQILKLGKGAPEPTDVALDTPILGSPGISATLDSSTDGRWAFATGADGTVVIDLEGKQPPWVLPGLGRPIAMAPGAPRAALASRTDRTVAVIDMAQHAQRRLLPAHASPVDGLTFAPDGTLLVSFDTDGTRLVWDGINGRRIGAPERQAASAQPMSPAEWIDSFCARGAWVRPSVNNGGRDSGPSRDDSPIVNACHALHSVLAADR